MAGGKLAVALLDLDVKGDPYISEHFARLHGIHVYTVAI